MKKINLKKIPVQLILLLVFIGGFVGGVMITFLKSETVLLELDVYSPAFFYKLKNITVDKRALLFLVLGKQLRSFLILLFLSTSLVSPFVFFSYGACQGFFIGSSLEILMIIYGISGIGIYGCLILPQGIFYFLAYSILLIQGLKKKKKEKDFLLSSERKRESRKKLLISLLLLGAGCVMEVYCNLFTLLYLTEG